MGFFGGIGKFIKNNPEALGILSDTLGGVAGREPMWAQMRSRQNAEEAERNKPYRFQNNNGDMVEINPATGEQRVLYKDQPKPLGPPEWEQTAQWLESQGRGEEAADIRAKARLMTETYINQATGGIEVKGIRPSSLIGDGAATGAPPAGEMTATNPQTGEKVRLNPQTGQWEPVGGAGPQTPPMFPGPY